MNQVFATMSNHKLRWVGCLTAAFAWIALITEVGFFVVQWGLHKKTMLEAMQSGYSYMIPRLVAPEFQMSSLSVGLTIALDAIYPLISVTGLALAGMFFIRLSKREIWSDRNIRCIYILGSLYIAEALLPQIYDCLQLLIFSIDVPTGEKVFSIGFGVSNTAFYKIATGVFLIAFGFIMREAKLISDDQKHYI